MFYYHIHILIIHLQNQLRKEGRRNEYERHKLQALNQRQKMVSDFLLLVCLVILSCLSNTKSYLIFYMLLP